MAIKLTDPFNSEGWIQAQKEPAVYGTSTGKWYGKTVTIGTQTWMAENLKVTHYKDGTPIPCYTFDVGNGAKGTPWCTATDGACAGFIPNGSNTEHGLYEVAWELQYGLLYNWYAVNNAAGLAPDGWHIPTEAERIVLTTYLDAEPLSQSVDLGSMLAGRRELWDYTGQHALIDSSEFGTSGFNALPAGYISWLGSSEVNPGFDQGRWLGEMANFWTATEDGTYYAKTIGVDSINGSFSSRMKGCGLSVRCIKD